MNTYITGSTIKNLREVKGLTQNRLAEEIGVTAEAIFTFTATDTDL